MKKTLLQEIKAMNKIAGTKLTKEQEVAIIRERLEQLNELEFGTQKAFDSYQKQHDLKPDTKVTVAGKAMSAGQAAKQSNDPAVNKIKGTSVFGGGAKKPAPSEKAKTTRTLNKIADSAQKEVDIKYGFLRPDGMTSSSNNLQHSMALSMNSHPNKKLQKQYNKDVRDSIKNAAAKAGITDSDAINRKLSDYDDEYSSHSGTSRGKFGKDSEDVDINKLLKGFK
jgi:hypothetical protein